LSKRITGWANLNLFGRGKTFQAADKVIEVLREELLRMKPDRVILSGDATALGFEAEFAHAAALLGLNDHNPLAGLAVPGNHDLYVRACVKTGLFERYFAPWLTGERVNEETYPFAQKVGHVWLVGVNSSVPNRLPMDARGRVGTEQLVRLENLLRRLTPGPRILVTHHHVCQADEEGEKYWHVLRDLDALIDVAARGDVCLWLHGHQHNAYHVVSPRRVPFPVVCAGSITQRGQWSYLHYTISGLHCHGVYRAYDPALHTFYEARSFDLDLHVSPQR
jgi:3',5'-cyclic AMP phosphodiesterase CpdA